jgi:hypothetical protein
MSTTYGRAVRPGAGERPWAIGDVNSIWPLTHVGVFEGDIVAANIAGDLRPANCPTSHLHRSAGGSGGGHGGGVQRHPHRCRRCRRRRHSRMPMPRQPASRHE